ncbi:hypothetical protein AB0J38_16330 [Streptomyces sp. NPDC050095]|uniref:hypothetical protein n=1 Tax=unclassified Streptomyces TaxID=2593676 RepID=UPI0034250383
MAMIDTNSASGDYVRFQSTQPDARGRYVGVFGLINNLAKQGRLSADQEAFRRANNDWYDAAYPDPSTVDPTVYDAETNPGAHAWFKPTATHLIERVPGYLSVLAAHGVDCRQVRSADPGRIVYEDDVQIVVVPHL